MIQYHSGSNYFEPGNIGMTNYTNAVNTHQFYQNGVKKINGPEDLFNSIDINRKLNDPNCQNNQMFPTQNAGMISTAGPYNIYSMGSSTSDESLIPYYTSNQSYNMIPYQNTVDVYSNIFQNPQQNSETLQKMAFANISNTPAQLQLATLVDENALKLPTLYNSGGYYENNYSHLESNTFQENRQPSNNTLGTITLAYSEQAKKESYANNYMGIRNGSLNTVILNPTMNFSPPNSEIIPMNVILENKFLWKNFSRIGNEMIITKHGRRIYPYLIISVSGLCLDKRYRIKAGFTQASPHRYKYQKPKGWKLGTTNDVIQRPIVLYSHPDGAQPGEYWMNKSLNFLRMKVTNNPHNKDYIHLNSMHLYVITIFISETDDVNHENLVFKKDLFDTRFVAVTAYQNKRITKLKIQHNHYAKGFKNGQRKPKESSDEGADESHMIVQDENILIYILHTITRKWKQRRED
ncbi:hypothetical protein HZS_2253, partial [Henneguya salminicola]